MPIDITEEISAPSDAGLEVRESVQRLSKDLALSASTLSIPEARYIVKQYYVHQHNRITGQSQIRDMDKADPPQSHLVLDWYFEQERTIEANLQRALDKWTNAHFMGRWAKSCVGIGPVISAGLLANIQLKYTYTEKGDDGKEVEVTKIRHTASSIMAFAGLAQVPAGVCPECAGEKYIRYDDDPESPDVNLRSSRSSLPPPRAGMVPCARCYGSGKLTTNQKWLKGQKRPWNADLKVLIAFKAGESFVKVQNNKADFYGRVFAARKKLEQERNEQHMFARQAAEILKEKKIGKDTDAYSFYTKGMLPPAHIHARARRYAAKLFISHYHYMAYRHEFGKEPPAPYVIEHLGHADYIYPPNMNFEQDRKS